MNGKKKRHVILIVLAMVVLAAGILGGRELWLGLFSVILVFS